ncbi:MAG: hypothetical protein H6861_05200 [Rhodospirillales bacterium]|nr:hypothetical protein [Rhodospirillales bacterium]
MTDDTIPKNEYACAMGFKRACEDAAPVVTGDQNVDQVIENCKRENKTNSRNPEDHLQATMQTQACINNALGSPGSR